VGDESTTGTDVVRRLAAILAADVVDYSRLMHADEVATLAALKARRRGTLDPLIARHGGRLFKLVGDGAMVEFGSAVSAVQCAVELQEAFSAANADSLRDRHIVLRIGVHLGDVMVEGTDLYGDGVNIAARLESLAEPGGVLVSEDVHRQIRNKLSLGFDDLGPQNLKNIAQPVRAFRVAAAGLSVSPHPTVESMPHEDALSIAVLPFDNMSGVPEHDYIGEGIAENILTDLSRFRDLTVIARNSSFAYKGKATRIQDIRRDLAVNYVLEGSVQRAGDRIRITAQLIEGATGKHLWAERYDRRVDDLFAVMDEITELIVGTLGTTYGGRLRKAASENATGAGPTSFRAFDHFVQGMQELNKFAKESIPSAVAHFQQAVAINPRYAKAHAKLAWAHLINADFGWAEDEAATVRKAREAADAAVLADDAEAWAHWAVAGCAMFDRQHDRALMRMRKALELNPNDADVLADMGLFCAWAGKAEEGLVHALRAVKINPHHPEYYADQLGWIYFDARQYENAIRTLDGLRTLCTPSTLIYLAASHAALGHIEAARAIAAKLLAREPQSTVSYRTNLIPYHDDRDRDHVAENLRLAGLPE
jgi:adenylate cyclase